MCPNEYFQSADTIYPITNHSNQNQCFIHIIKPISLLTIKSHLSLKPLQIDKMWLLANLKQLQSVINLKYRPMANVTEQTYQSTKLQEQQGSQQSQMRKMKGLQFFSVLFQLVDRYSATFGNIEAEEEGNNNKGGLKDERLERAQSISNILEQMAMSCKLQEWEKADCLEQTLKIIHKVQQLQSGTQSRGHNRSKNSQNNKAVQQIESSIIQKLGDLILKIVLPAELTVKNVMEFARIIIHQLLGCESSNVAQEEAKLDKGKKGARRNRRAKTVNSQYSLISGKKINMGWFLILKLLQSNFSQVQNEKRYANDSSVSDYDEKEHFSLVQLVEQELNKQIKEFINEVLLKEFKDYNLIHELLKITIENINQMELPILPFVLCQFHDIMFEKMIFYHPVFKHDLKPQTKEIYSLDNLLLFLNLIQKVPHEMMQFQAQKEIVTCVAICGYCGITKSNKRELLIYQKIAIRLSENQNIVVKICQSCCSQLRIEPSQTPNQLIFAPLILSRFWHFFGSASSIQNMKVSLKMLLLYHVVVPSKKHKDQDRYTVGGKVVITDVIAMNNTDENTSNKLIEQAYNYYLFNHSKLSIRRIINSVLRMLLIYSGVGHDKSRERIIKSYGNSHVLQYLHNENRQMSQEMIDQIRFIRDNMFQKIEKRINDSNREVKLAVLELICHFYNEDYNFTFNEQSNLKNVFNFTAFGATSDPDFLVKAIDIVEKYIVNTLISTLAKSERILKHIKIILMTFMFSLECLNRDKNSEVANFANVNEKMYKLVNKLLGKIAEICEETYEKQTEDLIVVQLNNYLKYKDKSESIITKVSQFYQKFLVKISKQIKISESMMKSLPIFTRNFINNLLSVTDSVKIEYLSQILSENIFNFINSVYSDNIQLMNQITSNKKQDNSAVSQSKNNMKELFLYMKSSKFIDTIVQSPGSKIPNSIRLNVLSRILFLNNITQIISKEKDLINHVGTWLKAPKKMEIFSKIALNEKSQKQMNDLVGRLIREVLVCDIKQVPSASKVIVDCLMLFGRGNQINCLIQTHEVYAKALLAQLRNNVMAYRETKNLSFQKNAMASYMWCVRCIAILTALSTNLERYLSFNNSVMKFNQQKLNKDSITVQQVKIETSSIFSNCYGLILEFMELMEIDEFQENLEAADLVRQIMNQLRYYWQIQPSIILASKNLLRKIVEKVEDSLLIKDLYRMFLQLLPCNNIKVLNQISNTMEKTFHKILYSPKLSQDDHLVGMAFQILLHMLKNGMSGMYQFTKYIIYGLLHPGLTVNQAVINIIEKIFTQELSEKILFMNLSSSLQIAYELLYKDKMESIRQLEFTSHQKANVEVLLSLTRMKGKVVLLRDRKQLRMRTTFVKKLGEHLTEDSLLRSDPLYLYFLMKILKSQTTFDYSQLYQIVFSLHSLARKSFDFIEKIREMAFDSEGTLSNLNNKELDTLLAFREMLSCLAYLTGYQKIQQQLKNFERQLDDSHQLYVTLAEDMPTAPFSNKGDRTQQIENINNEINLFLDVIQGEIEFGIKKYVHEDQSTDNSTENSTLTMKTKNKRGRRPKKANELDTKTRIAHLSCSAGKVKQSDQTDELGDGYKARLRGRKKVQYREQNELIY